MVKKPLYQQISEQLERQIMSGELQVGAQLPTEHALAASHQTSRITSKRALSELENKGLVERIRGKGTFVKARSISKAVTSMKQVLFILPFPGQHDLGNFTALMLPYLAEKGYHVHIQDESFLTQTHFFQLIEQYDGMIYYPETGNSNLDILYQLHFQGFPVVLLDKKMEGIPFPYVTADNFSGGYMAAHLLLSKGHTKIAFLNSRTIQETSTVRERYMGYLRALFEAGISFHALETNVHSEEAYAGIAEKFVADGVTAIVAENDLMAIQFMKQAKKMGIRIPQDLAVIGFDNIQAAEFVEPSLTTISQNFEEMGRAAAISLQKQIQKKDVENAIIPVSLIERESSGAR
ncbi:MULTISPECIES: substrate-binding domain-containing protein [unclassified Listeria]|uniref:GntR family transcriptional regulator n=1 Tax=unclassified Listeria TaxID=2642072 RepID=UPI000B59586A|nr:MULTISPECIES: GntR family transcriptional regulator [unclassified Listeria]